MTSTAIATPTATPGTVEFLAETILHDQRAFILAHYSEAQAEAETVRVTVGPVYTKVDVGPEFNMSGKYMVENSTGIIYGIKGYGKVHKGHRYGTLDTVADFEWGGYTAGRRVAR